MRDHCALIIVNSEEGLSMAAVIDDQEGPALYVEYLGTAAPMTRANDTD
jgi:hypothetical protein